MSTQWRGVKTPIRQNLVRKYRPIGPPAIVAAVYAMKKRKPARREAQVAATSRGWVIGG